MSSISVTRFRWCAKCGCTKPATVVFFPRATGRKAPRDGLYATCRVCKGLRYKAWYAANKARKIAYNAEWRQQDPERQKRLHKEWAQRNKERRSVYRKQLWRENEEYRQRDMAVGYARRHKAPYTTEALECLPILRKDPCAYCGGSGGTVDHIEPINAGGTGEWENLTGACLSCNTSKQDTSLLYFLLRR